RVQRPDEEESLSDSWPAADCTRLRWNWPVTARPPGDNHGIASAPRLERFGVQTRPSTVVTLLVSNVIEGARRFTVTRTHPFGRRAISGSGSASPCPAANSTRNSCNTLIRTRTISMEANALPTQIGDP